MEPVDGRSDGGKVIDLVEVVIPATNATERILKRPPPGDSEGGEDKMSSPTIAERVSQDRPNKVVGSNKKRERKDAKARNQRRPATDSTEVEEASDRSEGEGREESEVEVEEEVKESRTMRGTMSDSKIRAKKTKDHQVESAFKDMPKPSSPKVAKRTTRYRSRKRQTSGPWDGKEYMELFYCLYPRNSSPDWEDVARQVGRDEETCQAKSKVLQKDLEKFLNHCRS